MATLSTLNVRVLGNTAGLSKSLDKAESRLSKFKKKASKSLKAVGKASAALGVAGGAALVAFGAKAVTSFADAGDEIHKMAERTGFGTEALSELKFAAEQSGASLEDVEKASKRMASTIFDAEQGLVGAEDALAALGLTAEDLKGISPETQFQIIADKLGAVDDASTKAAIAQDVFGRSGADLIPLMNEGAEGMAALRQEARDLGVVFSQDAANSAADFKDAQNELTSAVNGLFFAFGEELTPAITAFTRFLVGNLPAIRGGIKSLAEGIETFIETAKELTKAVDAEFTARIEEVNRLIGLLTETFMGVRDSMEAPVQLFQDLAATVLSEAAAAIKIVADALLPLAEAFDSLLAKLSPVLPELVELATRLLVPQSIFKSLLNEILPKLEPHLETLAELVTELAKKAFPLLTAILEPAIEFFKGLFDSIANPGPKSGPSLIDTLTNAVLGVVPTLVALLDSVTPLIPVLLDLFEQGLEALAPVFDAIVSAITPLIPQVTDLIDEFLPLLPLLVELAVDVITPLISLLGELAETFAPLIPLVVELAIDVITPLIPLVVELAEVFAPLIPLLIELAIGVITPLIPLVLQLIEAFLPLIPLLIELAVDVLAALIPLVLELIEAFLPLVPLIIDLAETVLPPLVEVLALVIEELTPLIVLLAEGLVSAIETLTPFIEGLVVFIAGIAIAVLNAKDTWVEAWDLIKAAFDTALGGITNLL